MIQKAQIQKLAEYKLPTESEVDQIMTAAIQKKREDVAKLMGNDAIKAATKTAPRQGGRQSERAKVSASHAPGVSVIT